MVEVSTLRLGDNIIIGPMLSHPLRLALLAELAQNHYPRFLVEVAQCLKDRFW